MKSAKEIGGAELNIKAMIEHQVKEFRRVVGMIWQSMLRSNNSN